jgi:hypothetical protein
MTLKNGSKRMKDEKVRKDSGTSPALFLAGLFSAFILHPSVD